jgi:hypothetical protein
MLVLIIVVLTVHLCCFLLGILELQGLGAAADSAQLTLCQRGHELLTGHFRGAGFDAALKIFTCSDIENDIGRNNVFLSEEPLSLRKKHYKKSNHPRTVRTIYGTNVVDVLYYFVGRTSNVRHQLHQCRTPTESRVFFMEKRVSKI